MKNDKIARIRRSEQSKETLELIEKNDELHITLPSDCKKWKVIEIWYESQDI